MKLTGSLTSKVTRLFTAAGVALAAGCSNYLFYPTQQHLIDPEQHGIVYENVYIEHANGETVHGWLLPETGQPHKATIAFFHGNAINISTHLGAVHWLPQHGYRVLIIDYRGYGKSDGEVALDGAIEDILLTIDYTVTHLLDDKPFMVMGQSIGASMAIYATSQSQHKDKIDAAVFISAFSDYRQIVREALASTWLTWAFQVPFSLTVTNEYSPKKYIQSLSPIPVALFHGTQDKIIGSHHSKILYDLAREPKYYFKLEGGHNDLMRKEENRKKILNTLNELYSRTQLSP